jgi:DNA-binding NtrC family response regulator
MQRLDEARTDIERSVGVPYHESKTSTATGEYDPRVGLKQVESEWISKAIVHHGGNLVATAKSLGISRAKLYRKIQAMETKR